MSKPITVSDADFEEVVLKSSLPVIVDFWAPWCGPCKMIAPILEDIARQYEGKIVVAKVNTDENQTWMMRYGIQGIPTILFISNGKLVDNQVGAAPAKVLNQKVEALLNTVAAYQLVGVRRRSPRKREGFSFLSDQPNALRNSVTAFGPLRSSPW